MKGYAKCIHQIIIFKYIPLYYFILKLTSQIYEVIESFIKVNRY